MKRQIDLNQAADAEAFGALAVRAGQQSAQGDAGVLTDAQGRAVREMARSLLQIAREAGAEKHRIMVGDVSFELRGNGPEEVLSIRTASAF